MLDIKANQADTETSTEKQEVPRPRPALELPPIEPEANYLTLFAIIVTVLIVAAGVGIYVLKSTKISAYNTKEAEANDLNAELGASPLKELDQQITSLQEGLLLYQQAISGQILWSMMFKEFEKIVPKNVKFTALSMDEKQLVKLSGEGNDFTSIAKLVRSLENSQDFSDVKLVSATSSDPEQGGKINFAVTFTAKTAMLKEKTQTKIPEVQQTPAPAATNENQLPGSAPAGEAATSHP